MLNLFDHGTPKGLARAMSGHTVHTAQAKAGTHSGNGALLNAAEEADARVDFEPGLHSGSCWTRDSPVWTAVQRVESNDVRLPGSRQHGKTVMAAKIQPDDDLHEIIAAARQARERRDHSYRSHALKLLPPVCARCGRDFAGKNIRELTVHHKDHNHDNNPPDGSNWELLCLYCHENEHSRNAVASAYGERADADAPASSPNQPFADLDKLLKKPR